METKSPPTCPYSVTVRRNPPRKARPTTTTTTKSRQIPAHSSSSTVPDFPSFPTEEILSMEVSENPKPKLDSTSENIRVFLRIRPFLPSTSASKDQNPKSRAKNVWPQNPAKKNSARDKITNKKKSSDVCVRVNDHQSVTLSPPSNLQESKRIKSEVYEGFSHVFAPDSSQEEVYEKMVSPLVEDFLKGKSGMLATLGPSGSGKTHTVFGTPRDPGILPRTLQRIFKSTVEMGSKPRRSFSISIFEIQSERKGEKLFDLSPGGAELTMQKSTIKGLQEITVSDARQAESLVAHAMLNRLTATTNSNSQSSRSQCIINVRSVASKFEGEDDYQAKNAVLSIVDLAGAEREKKTGNQGARLLESNFINNTSMVFGLCLRSLLEHQKNPKRPLQKHFQNSLLTRYLRDYLEGKKRMALILTVKSGDEDYLDTTYLLRQASPFMRIRFDNVEEQPNIPSNKRQYQALSRSEQPKRMKFSGVDACAIGGGKSDEDEQRTSGQDCEKAEDTKFFKSEISNCAPLELNYVELAEKERSCQIWQNFAQAFWNTLKQYKEKLKVAEKEIEHLTENLKLEKTRYVEIEKKLGDAKSCSTCSQKKSLEIALVETETKLDGLDFSDFDKSNADLFSSNMRPSEYDCTPKKYDSTPRRGKVISSQSKPDLCSSNIRPSDCNSTPKEYDSNPRHCQVLSSQFQSDPDLFSSNIRPSECNSTPKEYDSTPRQGQVISSQKKIELHSFNLRTSKSKRTSDKFYLSPDQNQIFFPQVKEENCHAQSKGLECVDREQVSDAPARSLVAGVDDSPLCEEISQQKYQIHPIFSSSGHNAEDLPESKGLEMDDTSTNADVTDLTVSSSQSLSIHRNDSCSSVELDHPLSEEEQESSILPDLEAIVSTESYTGADALVSSNLPETEVIVSTEGDTAADALVSSNLLETEAIISTEGYTAADVLVSESRVEKPEVSSNLPETEAIVSTEGYTATDTLVSSNLPETEAIISTEGYTAADTLVSSNLPETEAIISTEGYTAADTLVSSNLPENKAFVSTEGYTAADTLVSSNLLEMESIVSTEGYTVADALVNESRVEKPEELLDPYTSVKEDQAITEDCEDVDAPSSVQRVETPCKPEKQKRRLLPASSVLLRDFNTLEIEDKSEKQKENRGRKKFYADERNRTQGSISLMRLLNNNIRV